MKILVTGGAGFIGSNVADAYVMDGHEVLVVDNLFTGKRENLNPRARFFATDIRSIEMRRLVEQERPDVINHHAAQMSVPASVEDPLFDADVNVMGFLNVLEAAKRSRTKKVIFISSGGAVYGEAAEYPTAEGCAPAPLSPYAITKWVSERYLGFYRHHYGLDYTVLRYANVYGPRQVPHGEAGVAAIFMDRLLSGRPSTVYRHDDEPKGMIRDYCFVGDVVKANLIALEKGSGGVFNIGTGVGTHTLDLYNAIFDSISINARVLAPELKTPSFGPARPGDLRRSCLDITLGRNALGWEPRSRLVDGLRLTLEWRLRKS